MTEDSTEEDRILDEALKRVTHGKTRIEDMKQLAEETNESINDLAKLVLKEIVDNVKKQAEWSIQRGAPPITTLKTYLAIQSTLLAFLNTLIGMWTDISGEAMGEENMRQFKDILGEKK